jgi:spore coat polysaccharide biosynthesis protein SpsF (cytidylyltransferase family)
MILGIIQARMGSTRLPGKVMKVVEGKPLLQHMVERVTQSKKVDTFVIATTVSPEDDRIQALCNQLHIPCFKGSVNDVLDRYYQCARTFKPVPRYIVRLTADCPLHDPKVIDFVVQRFLEKNVDYMTNSFSPVFEDGFDVEIFTYEVLTYAWENATGISEREHVTPFIHKMANLDEKTPFKIYTEKYSKKYHYKLSVDTATDFRVVKQIFALLYNSDKNFGMLDVIDLLEKDPSLLTINKESVINEGYLKSLSDDEIYNN